MKINKKATLATAGVLGIAAIVGTLGTMSYFTDTDSKTNVFTVGNVDITLNEQQRGIDTNGCKDPNEANLEDFTTQVLYPIVTSAQSKKDALAMPADCDANATIATSRTTLAKNYADKMVSVTNDGTSNAWVRVYYAVPAVLLDSDPGDTNQSYDILHFNEGSFPSPNETNGYYWTSIYPGEVVADSVSHGSTWLLGAEGNDGKVGTRFYYPTTIDGVNYAVFYSDIYQPLAPNATSQRVLDGFYLDAGTDIKEVTVNSVKEQHIFDKSGNDTGWKATDPINIPVYVVAIQDKGFDSTAQAVEQSFGANFDPFNAE